MATIKDRVFRFWTGLHRTVFTASRGRILGKAMGMPVVMLTTTGRRSGLPRRTMLTAPVVDGDMLVLVASYGGDDRHPAWFLNLLENPEVTAMVGGTTRRMRARVASAEEKERLWPSVTEAYKGYAGYQRRTDRDIPLVLLEPAT